MFWNNLGFLTLFLSLHFGWMLASGDSISIIVVSVLLWFLKCTRLIYFHSTILLSDLIVDTLASAVLLYQRSATTNARCDLCVGDSNESLCNYSSSALNELSYGFILGLFPILFIGLSKRLSMQNGTVTRLVEKIPLAVAFCLKAPWFMPHHGHGRSSSRWWWVDLALGAPCLVNKSPGIISILIMGRYYCRALRKVGLT